MIQIRNSQSNILPKLVEYLQGKILVRFQITTEIKEEQTFYNYVECCFGVKQTLQEIEAICIENSFVLTPSHKALIV